MSSCVRRRVLVLLRSCLAITLASTLMACATRPHLPSAEAAQMPHWSGRLAVQIESEPRQSVSASFDLRGSADRGELALFTPIGSTAAVLSWGPGLAVLREEGQAPRAFESLDSLIAQALGTPIPVQALFGWLGGEPVEAAGWQADLSRHRDGRLVARRSAPPPAAELRIVFEQP